MVAAVSGSPSSRVDLSPESVDVLRESRRSLPVPAASVWKGSDLVQSIAGALWERSPYAKLDLSLNYDRTELARTYSDSYQQLQGAASEVAEMLEAVCDGGFLLRQDERISADVRARWQQERQHDRRLVQFPIVPPDNALNFKSVGVEGLAKRLQTALRERVQQFASDLVQSLDGMAKQQLIGRIKWANNSDCRFTFQQRALTQEFLHTISQQKAIRDRQTGRRGVAKISSDVIQNTFSVVRHEHELINARKHELSQTVFPIPQPVQELVKTVPQWLHPLLRVVEGTQIKEQIGEVDVKTEKWRSKPQVVERVLFHNDPALVLDGFVLRGWGQREVALEMERLLAEQTLADQQLATQRQTENANLAGMIGGYALWSSIGLSVLAFVLRSALSLYAAWGLGVAAVGIQFLAGQFGSGSSGLMRSGRTLLILLGVQFFLYGVSGAGFGMLGLSAACGIGWASLQSARLHRDEVTIPERH